MQVRFGYVAMALNLQNASTSKTITLTNLRKLTSPEQKLARLRRIVKENLDNTLRVIRYNIGEQIHVYRLTSKLIPFATFPLDFEWNYLDEFSEEFAAIGREIRGAGLRISAHPDHFTVINSPDGAVFRESVKDLEYHDQIFTAMGLDEDYKLVVHLGGFYGDKTASINRFLNNFDLLPSRVQARLVLENDDKIYTAEEVLEVCRKLQAPMVLDIHHHLCNNSISLESILPEVWDTWKNCRPKIHVSSPKDHKNYRHHADYIEAAAVAHFLKLASPLQQDFDVMVEAKMKDKAMFRLVEDLHKDSGLKKQDPTTLEINS